MSFLLFKIHKDYRKRIPIFFVKVLFMSILRSSVCLYCSEYSHITCISCIIFDAMLIVKIESTPENIASEKMFEYRIEYQ